MPEDTQKDSVGSESSNDSGSSEDARRQRRKQPRHPDIPKTQAGKLWEAFGNPEEPVNQLPGGTYNSAGGKPKEVTWRNAFAFDTGEFGRLYQKPCVRDSLLVGLTGGMGVGSTHAVLKGFGRSLFWSAQFAAGSFTIFALSMYKWCDSRRKAEAQGMAEAVIMMKKLQEKKQREEAAEKAEQEARDAQRRAEEEAKKKKSWFW